MTLAPAKLRELLDRYRRAELSVGASTAALVLELGQELAAGNLAVDEFELALIAAEKLGFDASSGVAARHLAEIRSAQNAAGITEPAPFPLDAATVRAHATAEALRRTDDPGHRQAIVEKAAVWADRGAKMGGRRTVDRSAAASGRQWRRVPDGDPCTFCAMLATRGFLDDGYTSRDSALWTKAGRKYHDFCGCVATEIVDGWEPTPQEQRWIDAYETAGAAVSAQGLPLTPETVLPRMREAMAATAPLESLTRQQLEDRMQAAMDREDWQEAERAGELLDSSFYNAAGRRLDMADPYRDEIFDWYTTADPGTQDRFLDQLGDERSSGWLEAQYAATTGKATKQVPTGREQREQYEAHIETEYLAAENATNGHMLTAQARAAGRTSRDLWSVNESTARSWASPEMLEYWDQHGRMTWTDWQAMHRGDTDGIQKRSGTWLQ
ncbi:MAG: hypothetical protein IPJ61_17650 [Tessaracoccus sp.]|uniref:VG15 protein n=1 Tax=Tessaracoccus sp. TaxID=1971211 RepID=UPI001EB903E5|nr:hypothetical protein [Tessaracoccus sp.]MBK7822830.1 hypothetical protein [Tessaracoccus sp.]